MSELRESIRAEVAGKRLVFGEGNPRAELVIVGEAPGRQEEMQGHPFIGPAGKLLNQLLEEFEIKRRDIWITNVVKWHPVLGRKARTRAPLASEIKQNSLWLRKELEIISPRLLLCLGNIAAQVLIKRDFTMSSDHGKWFESITGSEAMATFHPAYLLRQGIKQRDTVLKMVRTDLAKMAGEYHSPSQSRLEL